jgi:hypothetical protein
LCAEQAVRLLATLDGMFILHSAGLPVSGGPDGA